ncbi:hypothetical protein EMN47_08635 [Prolixibacteraceae bacterium JC049]|nr:hypothetical protein [Prolixibacteraceae bacterium JC049]
MKSKIISIGWVAILLLTTTFACKENESVDLSMNPVLESVSSTSCKETVKAAIVESFVELKAMNNEQLLVKYINAEMNCCPQTILTEVKQNESVLVIRFFEEVPNGCKCNCYYDVTTVLKQMQKKAYKAEIYIRDEKKAELSFDFAPGLDVKHTIK